MYLFNWLILVGLYYIVSTIIYSVQWWTALSINCTYLSESIHILVSSRPCIPLPNVSDFYIISLNYRRWSRQSLAANKSLVAINKVYLDGAFGSVNLWVFVNLTTASFSNATTLQRNYFLDDISFHLTPHKFLCHLKMLT